VNQIVSLSGEAEAKSVDRWLISTIQNRINTVTSALEILKTRTAAEVALFEVWNDIRWYMRRTEDPNPEVLKEVANTWVRLLAPFTPYTSEELWHLLGNNGFVSKAEWPSCDSSKIDIKAEEAEDLIRGLIEDTVSIVRATKMTPKRICYYMAPDWKWKAYLKVLEKSLSQKVQMRDVMKDLMKEPDLKKRAKNVAGFTSKIVAELNAAPADRKQRRHETGRLDEKTVTGEARIFIEKELKAEVSIYGEEDPQRYDPKGRATMAKPYRPAIYIE